MLINDTVLVVNGPYTRYEPGDPNNEEKKSALDLVIASKYLLEHVETLEIDKELKWTPCKPIKKSQLVYSDHYALLLTLKNLPMKKELKVKRKKPVIWNTKKEGEWQRYHARTQRNKALEGVIEAAKNDIEEVNGVIEKTMKKLKYECFGKVSVSNKLKEDTN